MPVVRPRLFLSSTALDLREFRDAVVHVGQRLGFEVVAMEGFGPDPRAAAALCREKVEGADLFVGLFAHRYGYVPDGFDSAGITELEYDWARGRDVPVLAFLIDESLPWPPGLIEHGPGWDRLQAFKARLRRDHVVSPMTTPEQLRDDLFVHLPKFLERAAPPAPAPEPALPRPPEPYVAHQYTLLQTAQVIGRELELDRLDGWLADGDAHVLCVVAIGGMGKSALTWRWFQQRAASAGLAGRFWWSFYETDATFDSFVVAALAYCTSRSRSAVEAVPSLDREQELLAVLDREPFLLVLDGLERLLIAYSDLDFAHLSDDDLDRKTANAVADRLGLPEGFVSQHRLRKTIDPRIGNVLRKLARVRVGRVLVTTRLFPSELQTVTGQVLPGTEAWFLTGLRPDDAVALWRELGVSGDDPQLRALFARIDQYPLLIRALAGEVANYRPAPGDFARWQRDHPDFDPFALPLVQVKSHVLTHAIGDLAADARDVLHTVAAFRAPAEYATVEALFVKRQGWTSQRLDGVLTDLEDRGLLGWDRAANTYDLHPIVRGVVWNGLDDVRQRAVFEAVEQHFSAFPGPPDDQFATTPEEAYAAIELFTALVGLDRHEEAAELYLDRLVRARFDFHAYSMGNLRNAMLESLFADGLDEPPRAGQNSVYILANLGYARESAGRLLEAYELEMRSLSASESDSLKSLSLDSLAYRAFKLGKVREAFEHAGLAGELYSRGSFIPAVHVAEEALRRAETGDTNRALIMIRDQKEDAFHQSGYEARVRLLLGEFQQVCNLEESITANSFSTADDLRAVAAAHIRLGRAAATVDLLIRQLRAARSQGEVDDELDCLLLLAEAHCHLREPATAREYLEDLAEPAARGQYRYVQAKAAVILAELERDEGNRDAAGAAATDAYRLAWCDGPPHTYYWTLRRAEELLHELGAPVPDVR